MDVQLLLQKVNFLERTVDNLILGVRVDHECYELETIAVLKKRRKRYKIKSDDTDESDSDDSENNESSGRESENPGGENGEGQKNVGQLPMIKRYQQNTLEE